MKLKLILIKGVQKIPKKDQEVNQKPTILVN